jgi:spore coat polysaccharide biosynthesis protein SpsF
MKNIVAIVQARMTSTRLPEKVLLPIEGAPMLEWVVNRTSRAKYVTEVVVATTTHPTDDLVVSFCGEKGFQFLRGSVHDVLDRYYQTASEVKADIIVRITADCPLIDPELIDEGIALLFRGTSPDAIHQPAHKPSFDFLANRLPPPWGRTYPIGLDLEIFTFDFLQEAWRSAKELHQREHVTPYFYDDIPADELRYRRPNDKLTATETRDGRLVGLMHHTPDYGDLRWTVDTPEDLKLVRAIASHFRDDTFTWKDVLKLIMGNPALNQINVHVHHKSHLDVDDRA